MRLAHAPTVSFVDVIDDAKCLFFDATPKRADLRRRAVAWRLIQIVTNFSILNLNSFLHYTL